VLRRERREQQTAAYRNQQKMIEDTEKFIERFRYKPTKAVQVQSKIKQLKKLERIEIEDEDTSAMNIRFSPAPRSGTVVVEADEASKRYGSHLVLDRISMKIERGEKVAFVGRNGEGKTTLARMILGQVDFEGILRRGHNVGIGYFAQNQDELLNDEMTVFETVDRIAVGDIRTRLRDILGAFLFHGDDIDKKVKVLSGGERSRLAIVQLLLEPYNLLLLDEPTNHLDIRSKEILKQALIKFDGTLIVVSHDRDFLDGLVTKVYEFRHRKIKTHLGGIAEFLRARKIESLRELEKKSPPLAKGSSGIDMRASSAAKGNPVTKGSQAMKGNPVTLGSQAAISSQAVAKSSPAVAKSSQDAGSNPAAKGNPVTKGSGGEYEVISTGAKGRQLEKGSQVAKGNQLAKAGQLESWPIPEATGNEGTGIVAPPAPKAVLSYQEKKENERVLRRLQKKVNEAEAEITASEQEIAAMDARLAAGDPAVVSDTAFYTSYEEKKKKLEALMEQWENAHTELESFKSEYMNTNDTV
jgi:ABC-type multidrug transport system ATPase subunit